MKYYSTNKQAPDASLEEAVVKGLAADKGLFMPYSIKPLPQDFYDSIDTLSFQEIAYRVADAFFGEDVPAETLKQIVYDTLNFDVPLVKVTEDIYSLELFHGPTLAFKDVGGRFMARLLGYFIRKEGKKQVNVLVATSGDTGSAEKEIQIIDEQETIGNIKNGWIEDATGLHYYVNDQMLVSQGYKIDGYWYYFKDDGSILKGWREKEGDMYYYDEEGHLKI